MTFAIDQTPITDRTTRRGQTEEMTMSSSVNRPPEQGDGPRDPRRVPPADADAPRRAAGTDPDDTRYAVPDSRGDAGIRDAGSSTDARHDADDRAARDDEAGRRRAGTTERIVKERTRASRGIARTVAAIIALVFLAVGVLGFIPGVTSDTDQLAIAGHHSGAMLLGVFQVSVLHNVIHLLFGVVGLVMSRTAGAARAFLIVGGLIYLALWVLGLLFGHVDALNVVPVNDADNWLHLGLGAVMLLLGLVVGRRRTVSREVVG